MRKITEISKRSCVRVKQSLELILLKKILPKTKRERSPTGRSQNRPRRNSKAIVIIVARLVIDLLIVMLQERTKTKAKAKVNQTSWKRWKMQMTCV